jgi:hypothetical protein
MRLIRYPAEGTRSSGHKEHGALRLSKIHPGKVEGVFWHFGNGGERRSEFHVLQGADELAEALAKFPDNICVEALARFPVRILVAALARHLKLWPAPE